MGAKVLGILRIGFLDKNEVVLLRIGLRGCGSLMATSTCSFVGFPFQLTNGFSSVQFRITSSSNGASLLYKIMLMLPPG